eukprot:10110962-Ditylum_brightwellii.AAC.1
METEVTEDAIRDTAAELVQLQEEITQLDARHSQLRAKYTGLALVVLFTNSVDLDTALAGHIVAMLIHRGIFKYKNQDKAPIIPWSGTDPDSKINCFSWPKDDSKW